MTDRPQPDAYLPVLVENVPADYVFDGHALRPAMAHYTRLGVVKVFAGPETCDLLIDVRRPYFRPMRGLSND